MYCAFSVKTREGRQIDSVFMDRTIIITHFLSLVLYDYKYKIETGRQAHTRHGVIVIGNRLHDD